MTAISSEFKVPKRQLGPNGPEVPVYALGSWNIWDRMTRDEALALIDRAQKVDCAFFDVAYYNMGPHAEQSRTDILFGEAIKESGLKRSDFMVCGKLWLWEYPKLNFKEQIEISLERAQLDKFEMVVVGDYFAENPDMENLTTEVNKLIDAGLIDHWGINNWIYKDTRTALDFAKANDLVPPTFAQLKYSVVRRTMTEGKHYAPLFERGELALQASDCLEGGILAGKTPNRKIGADVGDIRQKIYNAVPELEKIAKEFDASLVQVALAFCLAHPATANVLFGASKLSQFEDNLGAIELAQKAGPLIRERLDHLWLDQHVPEQGGF